MNHPVTRVKGPAIQVVDSLSYLGRRYLRERTGDFSDTTLSAKLGSTATNHLVLLPPSISHIDVDTTSIDSVALTAMPNLNDGRDNHSNDVYFGQLHIDNSEESSVAELVAIKYLHRLRVPSEMHASFAINRRFGDQLAFAPLGFVKGTTNVGYVTRYEHSVVTLDNVLWDLRSTREQRLSAMSRSGLWMSSLHNHGLAHGDAQAKNIAFDSYGKPRYPDLEKTTDISYGFFDKETKRLLDIADLYNQRYMPPVSREETEAFVYSYLKNQSGLYGALDGSDIMDTIDSCKERRNKD